MWLCGVVGWVCVSVYGIYSVLQGGCYVGLGCLFYGYELVGRCGFDVGLVLLVF